MRNFMHIGIAALVAGSGLVTCLAASAADVTPERLANAGKEPQNWLLPFGNYAAWSYTALDEINRNTVANLRPKFMVALGGTSPSNLGGATPANKATPVVNDGFMYVHNAWGRVMKIDVRSGTRGQVLWSTD